MGKNKRNIVRQTLELTKFNLIYNLMLTINVNK